MNNLEHIRIKELSSEERSRVWSSLETKLPETPVRSPFVQSTTDRPWVGFPMHKALSLAFAFVLIVGTVGISDSARPGDTLFPIDRAVERVEATLNPSSRARHAQERFEEFASLVGSPTGAGVAMKAGDMAELSRTSAPQAEMAAMFALVDDASAPTPQPLDEETEAHIETTRLEIEMLLGKALMQGDQTTINEILAIQEAFEQYVASLRAQ